MVPIDWATFWRKDTAVGEFVVPGVVPSGRQVAIFSPAKTGKSLFAVDVCAALATGRSVLGHAPRPPCSVLYLDMEMTDDDVRERLESLDYGAGDDLSALAYYSLPALPDLDTREGGEELESLVLAYKPELVVVDTMARVVQGDENDSTTYRDFYRHSGVRLKRAGVALLRLDHAGKDLAKGQRGSSAKADDLDVIFSLGDVEDRLVLKRTHSRVPWVPAEVVLRREKGPLRHVTVTTATPVAIASQPDDATRETAALLDALGVPAGASVRVSETVLRTAGHRCRGVVVQAAVRLRKARQGSGHAPGHTPGHARRDTTGHASDKRASAQADEGEVCPGHSGTQFISEVCPPVSPLRGIQDTTPKPDTGHKGFLDPKNLTPEDDDGGVEGDSPTSSEGGARRAEEHERQRGRLAFEVSP